MLNFIQYNLEKWNLDSITSNRRCVSSFRGLENSLKSPEAMYRIRGNTLQPQLLNVKTFCCRINNVKFSI